MLDVHELENAIYQVGRGGYGIHLLDHWCLLQYGFRAIGVRETADQQHPVIVADQDRVQDSGCCSTR